MTASVPALVVRFGAMGDMVQFSAAIAAISAHHRSPVDVLTNAGASTRVLAGMPAVAQVHHLDHRRWPRWLHPAKRRLERAVLARGVRTVWAFDSVPGVEARWAAQGVEVRRCYGLPIPAGTHGSDADALVLRGHGVATAGGLPAVRVSAEELAAARALLEGHGQAGPALVFQPGNSRTMHPLHRWRTTRNLKAWPAESWSALGAALLERHPGSVLVLAGAPGEWPDCEDIRLLLPERLRPRCLNLARALPLRLLAGLLGRAALCVSVDTGPAHLAAALGCPLAVLFGPADPAVMAPRGPAPVAVLRSGVECSPCYGTARRRACRDNICMQRIGVERVLEECLRIGLRPAQI
jgi:heptosyltransferase-2/heptosyltransferase-3